MRGQVPGIPPCHTAPPDRDLSPLECRILELLRKEAGAQAPELARTLGLPVFTVVSRLPRLRRRLREPTDAVGGFGPEARDVSAAWTSRQEDTIPRS